MAKAKLSSVLRGSATCFRSPIDDNNDWILAGYFGVFGAILFVCMYYYLCRKKIRFIVIFVLSLLACSRAYCYFCANTVNYVSLVSIKRKVSVCGCDDPIHFFC